MVAHATVFGFSNVADRTQRIPPTFSRVARASCEDLVSYTARWTRMATTPPGDVGKRTIPVEMITSEIG